jgi:hypothetical protein
MQLQPGVHSGPPRPRVHVGVGGAALAEARPAEAGPAEAGPAEAGPAEAGATEVFGTSSSSAIGARIHVGTPAEAAPPTAPLAALGLTLDLCAVVLPLDLRVLKEQ